MDIDDLCSRVISCLKNPCHTLQLGYATTVGTGGDRDRVHTLSTFVDTEVNI